jgi:hypothetical protein
MSCRCDLCGGSEPQSLFWCLDHAQHVVSRQEHREQHPSHRVFRFDKWVPPPKRRYPMLMTVGDIPSVIDLISLMVKGGIVTKNQLDLGSCTANDGTYDREFCLVKQNAYVGAMSRIFLYRMIMKEEGMSDCQDVGGYMENIGQALADYGVCTEATLPYITSKLCDPISDDAFKEAFTYKMDPNQYPVSYDQWPQALYNALQTTLLGTVRVGIPVPRSYMQAVDNGGWVPNPTAKDDLLGGHAVTVALRDATMIHQLTLEQGVYGLLQSWGSVGDLSRGISIFKHGFSWFLTDWVQSQGGADSWQQPDLPVTPVPPQPTDCLQKTMTCLATAFQQPNFWDIFLASEDCTLNGISCVLGQSKLQTLLDDAFAGKSSIKKMLTRRDLEIDLEYRIKKRIALRKRPL